MSKVTVSRWQERYLAKGIPGLRRDGTRPGRKPPLIGEAIRQVVDKTLHEKPAAGTHWTSRKMAAACIRRGVFKSVAELEAAIEEYLETIMPIRGRSSGLHRRSQSLRRCRAGDKR
jgi:Homeodomain-like domain